MNTMSPEAPRRMTDQEAERYFWTVERTEDRPTGVWASMLRLLGLED